jgi:hypothetical protein
LRLRSIRIGINLDAVLRRLDLYYGRKNKRGTGGFDKPACSSKVEEMGERPGHGTEFVSPIKKEKSTI